MKKSFSINDVPLSQLLEQAAVGELQLPDFQRGWVWDDNHIVSLLASISLSFPIGAVMTLATGNPEVKFRPRLMEGVNLDSPREPGHLLLDGQQRLTSLYYALRSPDAVVTHDARGRTVKRHYYANIERCIDPYADREEDGIVSIPEERLVTENFGRTIKLDLSTREHEIANEMFPLDLVFDPDALADWQWDYILDQNRRKKWKLFSNQLITPFRHYHVPTIELSNGTSKEAVCQVFEKVNTGGVSLTVFEMLTATFAADDFNLRDDWKKRKAEFDNYPVLERFQAPLFLQVVTLLATYDRRMRHLDGPIRPPVACKRRDILRLRVEHYRQWSEAASSGLNRAVEFLHGECIFSARDMPYPTQLVPLGAILAVLGDQADSRATLEKIRRWFWCGVFGEMYGGTTETRFSSDLPECVAWVRGEAGEPRTVKEAQFQADRLLSLRTRTSAAYKGLFALQMKGSCRDFETRIPLEANAYFDNNVDIHRIFPKRWCNTNDIPKTIANCIVNKAPIGSHTKRLRGGNAPSRYLRKFENEYKIDSYDLDTILLSHEIDPVALRQDDFPEFFNQRFEKMLKLIAREMGKPVNRSSDRDESPFASKGSLGKRVRKIIVAGESDTVEFKSTGRRNLHTGGKDPVIEWSIVKSVAAFMNTGGGELLVGVDDQGRPVGIEGDYAFVKSHNRDGWELWLSNLISTTLGKIEAVGVAPRFCVLNRKTVAYIRVRRASGAVFATPTKSASPSRGQLPPGRNKLFYVRMGNATEQLSGNDLLEYTKKRWPS